MAGLVWASPEASPRFESRHLSTITSFVTEEFLANLPSAPRAVLDEAPFGVVRVDDSGFVLLYNRWESEMAGVPVAEAEGRNFFKQVAPCTNNRLMFGRFKEGIDQGALDVEFDFTFTYRMKPTNVRIRLYRHSESCSNWILVRLRPA